MHFKLAFIGFGTVGQGLAEILIEKKQMLSEKYDFHYTVVAISDILKGSVYDENGLDLQKILELVKTGKKIDEYPSGKKGLDSLTTIKKTNADTIIEITYTDIKTGEPATTHIKTALNAGKNVVSTNKGPVVRNVNALLDLAKKKNVHYGFEGVVLAGTPALNLAKFTLAGNKIKGFKGILNGTTNYILTRMGEGMSYADALKKAQELGYAEADPTADVEGFDAMGKVVILTNVVLGKNITIDDVQRKGITEITKNDVEAAKAEGKVWKLIGSAEILEDGFVKAKVWPEKLPLSDPLAGVSGAINALTYFTDELGPVTIVGPGAGKRETGFALLIDLLEINRKSKGW
ncbi:MAG: homoserine dehydrogenase [Candidatus Thermoplasmatota archaeon]|jgi:homoserine dehydrogenase|nr:homoserine dehydrogenase [Candidatus Thermoplasmatota archaeon]